MAKETKQQIIDGLKIDLRQASIRESDYKKKCVKLQDELMMARKGNRLNLEYILTMFPEKVRRRFVYRGKETLNPLGHIQFGIGYLVAMLDTLVDVLDDEDVPQSQDHPKRYK